jgi:hypothetical protein
MAALNVEQYEKQIKAAVDRWSKKIAEIGKVIVKINYDISTAEARLRMATKEGEKTIKGEIDALKKARDSAVKKIDAADLSLKVELMMIEPPEKTKSNEKEFAKLPGFIGEVVEKGGVPLGKTGVVLKPDVGFDLKAGKLKNFGIDIKLEW